MATLYTPPPGESALGRHAEVPHTGSAGCKHRPPCMPVIEMKVADPEAAVTYEVGVTPRSKGVVADGSPAILYYDGSMTIYRQKEEKVGPAPITLPEDRVDTTSPRASALNEARDLITGDRNAQYGPPTQDFARTADLLNALGYVRRDAEGSSWSILPSDVAIIIAQVKMSRLMHSRGKRDNWVDLAGYAGCGYECATEEAEGA